MCAGSPRAIMRGTKASTPWMTPQRLTPRTPLPVTMRGRLQRAPRGHARVVAEGRARGRTPRRRARPAPATCASSVTSVRTASALTPSACASPATAAHPRLIEIGHDDVGALAREPQESARAHAAGAARHHGRSCPVTPQPPPRLALHRFASDGGGLDHRFALAFGCGSHRGPATSYGSHYASRIGRSTVSRVSASAGWRRKADEPGGLGPSSPYPGWHRRSMRRSPAAGWWTLPPVRGEVEAVDAAEVQVEDDHPRACAHG